MQIEGRVHEIRQISQCDTVIQMLRTIGAGLKQMEGTRNINLDPTPGDLDTQDLVQINNAIQRRNFLNKLSRQSGQPSNSDLRKRTTSQSLTHRSQPFSSRA